MKKWIALAVVALVLGGTVVGLDIAARRTARRMNAVHPREAPFRPYATAAKLHPTLLIADMHADSLLWSRDLNERGTTGHVDVPRLIEGNVGLQIFSVVTQTPAGINPDRNDDKSDDVRLLALAQRWPPATWVSLRARALHQAEKLERTVRESNGALVLVRTRGELASVLASKRAGQQRIAALLALEGMHALEGRVENVDVLFDAGFRMMAPAHFFDTDVGGSAHGVNKGGLTELGRAVIRRMEEKRMIVDLAHASAATIDDVLAMATRPVVVSHTGVRGTCDSNRNLSDGQLQAIARNGGVIGIGYFRQATCGTNASAIARAIRHAANVAGVDHVGLGSDFDGAVVTPFDTAGLLELTQSLLEAGFDEDDIRKIMGGNVASLLATTLP